METTPNDLRQQQFEIKFRGYNPDDVEVFRDMAAAALEESRAEVMKLSEENKHLKERLAHLISLEDTLKAAVIEAQRNAEITIANARREAETLVVDAKRDADLVMKEARLQRDQIVGEMHSQMNQMVADINKIRFIRSNYLAKLRMLVKSQMETVEQELAEDIEAERQPRPARPTPEAGRPSAEDPIHASNQHEYGEFTEPAGGDVSNG